MIKSIYWKKDERLIAFHQGYFVPGYRQMQSYLAQEGIHITALTSHRMRTLGLKTIIRRQRPDYTTGTVHKVFPNILNLNFSPKKPNRIWATDFTYLPMANRAMHYNCTIIDLYDRSNVATLNGSAITAELAIQSLQKAFERHTCQGTNVAQ